MYISSEIMDTTQLCSIFQTPFAPTRPQIWTRLPPFWFEMFERIGSGAISQSLAGHHGANLHRSHKNIQSNSIQKTKMARSPELGRGQDIVEVWETDFYVINGYPRFKAAKKKIHRWSLTVERLGCQASQCFLFCCCSFFPPRRR